MRGFTNTKIKNMIILFLGKIMEIRRQISRVKDLATGSPAPIKICVSPKE